jgi:hypothetical protein
MLRRSSPAGTRNTGDRKTLKVPSCFPNAVFPWYRREPATPPAASARQREIVSLVDERNGSLRSR